jgi:hypothetical protein
MRKHYIETRRRGIFYMQKERKKSRRRTANRIGHILGINRILKRIIEGQIEEGREVTGSQGRRRKQLLDGVKERRGYWKLKQDVLDSTMWRTRFGRRNGPIEDRLRVECRNLIMILSRTNAYKLRIHLLHQRRVRLKKCCKGVK